MSTLKLNNIEAATGTTINIASGNKLSGAAGSLSIPGSVIQVQQSTADADLNTASTSYVQGPTTSTFTMKDSSNKVLVTFNAALGGESEGYCAYRIMRDSTEIGSSSLSTSYSSCYIS